MVCCQCEASSCKGGNCKSSQIRCTIFCACEEGPLCINPLTRKCGVDENDSDENWDVDAVANANGSVHDDDV